MESELGVVAFPFSGSLSKSLKPKERLVSISLEEVVAQVALTESYRGTAAFINRAYHRRGDNALVPETIKARCIRLGKEITSAYEADACKVLEQCGIDPETGLIGDTSCIPESALRPDLPPAINEQQLLETISACNEGRQQRECVADTDTLRRTEASADDCVYICVDDVGVKRQKEARSPGYSRDRKYVQNTVIHIACGERQQTLTAIGMANAFRLLVAFLLANRLMEDRRLIFISDGARDIKEHITAYFGFREHTLILDWLHLKKKVKELLSMGVKGVGNTAKTRKQNKDEIVRDLLRILWAGNAGNAISYLDSLSPDNVKSLHWMNQIKEYIERKRENIVCYAVRNRLGLRTSSNRVEKANDLLVASRQKHNGMSWSENGSGALAVISALRENGRLSAWFMGDKELLIMRNAS